MAPAAVDSDDDDEDEESEEEEDKEEDNEEDGPTMSLSAMLDGNPEGSDEDDEDSDSDSNPPSNDEDEEDAPMASDSENDESPDALEKLDTFIDGLSTTPSTKKRKASGEGEEEGQRASRKRRILPERTEAGAENEFAPMLTRGDSGPYFVFVSQRVYKFSTNLIGYRR